MACRESSGGVIFLWLGLVVFTTSRCHSARLPQSRSLANDPKAMGMPPEVSDETKKHLNNSRSQYGKIQVHHGRLLIGKSLARISALNQTKASRDVEADYQADMGWEEETVRLGGRPEPEMTAVNHLLNMEPKVECTVNSMILQVHNADSTPEDLFVDRGSHLPPLPLSKLPPDCGYTVRSTQRDLVLLTPYDSCFIQLEDGSYILRLRWWGIPVWMSCPLMSSTTSNPPMVTCHATGMVVTTEWTISYLEIQVNLNGNWEPISEALQRCLFSVVEHTEGVVISVNYAPCLKEKDGLYTLKLAGDGEMNIICPALLSHLPKYSQNDSTLQPHPAPFHTRDKSPTAEMLSPLHDPSVPWNSEITYEKQDAGMDHSRLAYYLHPRFVHAQPPSPESLQTAQLIQPTSPSSPVIHSEDQRWQILDHLPFPSQSYIPDPTQSPPSMIKLPTGWLNQELHPKQFLHPPFLLQKHMEQPVSQKQRMYYHYVSYYQQPGFEAHHTESSTPHQSFVEELPETPNPPHRPNHEKPHGQGVQKPEAPQIQEQQHSHSYIDPQPGFRPANNQPSVSPEAEQSHIDHRVHNNPFLVQSKPIDQLAKRPVHGPQDPQLQKTFYHRSVPETQPFGQTKTIYKPLELDILEDKVLHTLHTDSTAKIQLIGNTAADSEPHEAEVFQSQVHQSMNLYPHIDVNGQQLEHPQPAAEILGDAHDHSEKSESPPMRKNVSAGEKPQSAHTSGYNPSQIHMYNPFNFFFDPWNLQDHEPKMLPQGTHGNQQVPHTTAHQTSTDVVSQTSDDDAVGQERQPSFTQRPLLNCPPTCLPELPTCCTKIAFHQHRHHLFGPGNNNDPFFPPGHPLVPSSISSGDGFGDSTTPQKLTGESKSIHLITTSSSAFLSQGSLPSVNGEQTYLQPQDGIPVAAHDGNPSEAANLNKQVSHFKDSPNPQWLHLPQDDDLHTLSDSESPALYDGPAAKERQNTQSAGNRDSHSRPNFMHFNGQDSQEKQGGYLVGFNGSSKPSSGLIRDVHSITQTLPKQSRRQAHNPENLNHLLPKQPKWLGEEISNSMPADIHMHKHDGHSASLLSTSVLDDLPESFLDMNPSVDATLLTGDLMESSDHRKSLTPIDSNPYLSRHVHEKRFQQGSTAG